MKNLPLLLCLILVNCLGYSQIPLTISGQTYTNSDENWTGVNVPRSSPTALTFKNNSITSNTRYYMLQAGDDGIAWGTAHNLDGAIITGNKLTWNGLNPVTATSTHDMLLGFNINYTIKYNYLEKGGYGFVIKSGEDGNNFTYTSGGVAYNILKNILSGVHIKGMNGVKVYNNTLYNDISTDAILVKVIRDNINSIGVSPSNTKIKNNIFYTKQTMTSIAIDQASLSTLECDYNVYYCETSTNNEPRFKIITYSPYLETIYTWTQWRALGFDAHSIIVNPNFKDLVNFVPNTRLNYGTDLGADWDDGLSIDAVWGTIDPVTTVQNGLWQVGARIYNSSTSIQRYSLQDAISIFPNPSHGYINILIRKPDLLIDNIRIINLSGEIVFEEKIGPYEKEIQIAIDLADVLYIIQLGLGDVPLFTQKLVGRR